MAKSNQLKVKSLNAMSCIYNAITYTAEFIQIAKQQLGFGKHGISFHLDFLQRVHVNLRHKQTSHFLHSTWIRVIDAPTINSPAANQQPFGHSKRIVSLLVQYSTI